MHEYKKVAAAFDTLPEAVHGRRERAVRVGQKPRHYALVFTDARAELDCVEADCPLIGVAVALAVSFAVVFLGSLLVL